MTYTAADGSEKVTLLVDIPDKVLDGVTADLTTAQDAQDFILKTTFSATATDSDTHNDTPLGSKGQWSNFAGQNADASITVLRDLDDTGRPETDSGAEDLFNMVKVPGTTLAMYVRKGPEPDEDWAVGDEVRFAAIVTTGVPREPSDPTDGFIKVVVPLAVQDFETYFELSS